MAAMDGGVCTSAISIQLNQSIETAVRQVFNDQTIEIGNNAKFYWPRKRYRGKFDILLDMNHLSCPHDDVRMTELDMQKIGTFLKSESRIASLIQRFELVNVDLRQLGLQLDRSNVTSAVLHSINNTGRQYGQLSRQLEWSVLIQAYMKPREPLHCCNLTQLRTVFIANLIGRILTFLGCNVQTNHNISKPGYCVSFNESNGVQDSSCQQRLDLSVVDEVDCNDKNLELENQSLQNDSKEVDTFISVTCESLYHESQTLSVIWKKSANCSSIPTFIYVKHGLVTLISEHESLSSHLYQKIFEETKRSSIHRYVDLENSDVNSDVNEVFHSLADFTLKMDLLTRLASHTIKYINVKVAVRNGAFVMYNYARICVLLGCFQDKVQQNLIPPLPPISEVDLSLLKREEEWHLVLLCAKYPDVIMEITEDLIHTSTFLCHKLIKYLVELSHCLSIYYNRINILADIGSHLQSILFARIQLLLCIKQLMENIFSLLDVTPINKM